MSATKKKATAIESIASEIVAEREAQEAHWGQQDHPSSYSDLDIKRAEKQADRWKQINDARVSDGTLTWDGILLEEVYEALAEKDPSARRAELIQVAAVAAAEAEAIDRALAAAPESASESSDEPYCATYDRTCDRPCEAGGPCLIAAEFEGNNSDDAA